MYIHVAGPIKLNQDFLGQGVCWGQIYILDILCLQKKKGKN